MALSQIKIKNVAESNGVLCYPVVRTSHKNDDAL
jgi:hypothetical protein